MRRWVVGLACFVGLLGDKRTASAAPDLWARARDPALAERERTTLFAADALDRADYARDGRGFLPNDHVARDLRVGIRDMLLSTDQRAPLDVNGRLQLARACRDIGDYPCVVKAMTGLEAEQRADHDYVSALFSYAIALAKTGRTADEVRVYERYLELQPDSSARASALSNLAEARMRLLDFQGAIRDYRETLSLARGGMTTVLTRWGLAMALDRSGDLSGAIEQAALAVLDDRPGFSYLDDPSVFFVPPYEAHWLKALGEMAKATKVKDPTDQAALWEAAARLWDRYIGLATVAQDSTWTSLAQSHMRLCLSRASRLGGSTKNKSK